VKTFPLVLFVYKRPDHTLRTLKSLAHCKSADQTDLFIFSDGPRVDSDVKPIESVRKICRQATGFQSVTMEESPLNRGLAESVIAGVGAVLAQFSACIVVEDDLVVAPAFLEFLNKSLEVYQNQSRVFSLSGYAPPHSRVPAHPPGTVWFAPRPCSWGWAIWKDRWDHVDWDVTDHDAFFQEKRTRRGFEQGGRDLSYFLKLQLRGKLDSWAVRMAWSQSRVNGLTMYPTRSFVENGGLDGTGTHSRAQTRQLIDLTEAKVPSDWPEVDDSNDRLLRQFRRHYEGTWTERWAHRLNKLSRLFGSTR